ncbi:MAG: site-2 protease family protein [Anaerolineae bacterium]|nr:site-2 protease family protein [Anaerolineae bacterium]
MKSSVRLGKIFGIPIGINYTWLIVFALVTLTLGTAYFPSRYPEWSVTGHLSMGLLTSLLFFASVVIHELGHSVVAMAWGIPVKSITLFIFGGVANIGREPDRPLSEFLIAIAGPISSLFLALGFGLLWLVGEFLDVSQLSGLGFYLGTINLWLALFNMIPGFPLDGGRVFRSLVWAWTGNMYRATRWAATMGRVIAILMIVGGGVLFLTGNWSSGLWLAFIGWFLDSAASQSAQQIGIREALEGYTAGDFASTTCQPVESNMPLDWIVRDYVLPQGESCFLVTDGLQPEGVATVGQIEKVPRQRWGWTPIRQVMTPLVSLEPAHPGDAASTVLERMLSEGLNLLPVVDAGKLVGLVQQENLLHFAKTRAALRV